MHKLHRCRCSDDFSFVLNRLNLLNKIRPAVACRGAHQKVFFHTFVAYSSNDATKFKGIADRFTALSFVDHDLPLENGHGIKEVTVRWRAQNLCQLPDHTRFAGRLELVDQCSPSLKSFSLFCWSGQFSTLSLCRRESVRDRSLLQHSSAQHLPIQQVEDPSRPQKPHLQVVPPLI